jgi:exopolyphosphatase/guanosine-5'-triphosphate,3'-diphosphate pyrophosphatase
MRTSPGALREGVIYDLIGRFGHEDVRTRTVSAMQQRYQVDQHIADLVCRRVETLASATVSEWRLLGSEVDLLIWAAAMHEVGAAVSQKNYSQHSAYLVLNSDLPGFAQQDQEVMAALISGLKGKVRSEILDAIPSRKKPNVVRMMILLRLAVTLKHVEEMEDIPDLSVCANGETLTLTYPQDWGEAHPLTIWEIQQSKPSFEKLGITVSLSALT